MRWWIPVSRICKFFSWTTQSIEDGRTEQHGLYRLIMDRAENLPYLHRYYLLNTRWLERWFPRLSYRIVLHHTVLSDDDGLHNHPWTWYSKIISGGYWEHTPEGTFWRGPEGGWRKRGKDDFHRLVLEPSCKEETWSLFVMGAHLYEWGFLDKDDNWVQHEEYINNRHLYI